MGALRLEDIETDRARLRASGADPMSGGLLGVLRNQCLELDPCPLMFGVRSPGPEEDAGEFSPAVRGAHVHHPDSLDARPRRLDSEEARRLTAFDAAPEFLLRG